MSRSRLVVVVASLAGCSGSGDGDTSPTGQGGPTVPVLGDGTHALTALEVDVIGDADDALDEPRDLALHPDADELWIVNQGDESVTILFDPGSADPDSKHAWDATGEHFLAAPSGIAFGDNGNFATIHDLYESTQGGATGPDFMGPTLWTGDSDIFDGGHLSHLDMLHNSPNGKGIAWEKQNRYWVYDGLHQAIAMYDFYDDHGLGGTDHADGEVARYVEDELDPNENLPSHVEMDRETGILYVVDPGKARIATLDTNSGEEGGPVAPNYDGTDQYEVLDAALDRFVDTDAAGMGKPVGIALADGMVFVSSVDPSAIHAFDLTGAVVDWLDLAEHEPNGIEIAADGTLYFVDPKADEVVRIRVP